jgi:hypothetical protein
MLLLLFEPLSPADGLLFGAVGNGLVLVVVPVSPNNSDAFDIRSQLTDEERMVTDSAR